MTIDEPTPQERWAQRERPLEFIRIRLHRGGQAELVRTVLSDEVEALFGELAELRGKGKNETDQEIAECAANIRHLNAALRDISNGMIELVGPDGP